MRIMILDTEATGVPGAQLCQLAYLIWDGCALNARNWFFAVEEMTPGAQQVHGLSIELLRVLSENRAFANAARAIHAQVSTCPVWVGHNIGSDAHLLIEAFAQCGLSAPKYEGLCTQKLFTPIVGLPGTHNRKPKPPKLEELIDFLKITPARIARQSMAAFHAGAYAHDARWDAMAAYLSLMEGARRNLVKIPVAVDTRRLEVGNPRG